MVLFHLLLLCLLMAILPPLVKVCRKVWRPCALFQTGLLAFLLKLAHDLIMTRWLLSGLSWNMTLRKAPLSVFASSKQRRRRPTAKPS